MIPFDANVLIHGYSRSDGWHASAKRWLEGAVAGLVPVRVAWISVLAFVRIMTHPQVFRRPLSLGEVVGIVDEWLKSPMVSILEPDEQHWSVLRPMLLDGQAAGALSSDAHLAALAIEHGATLYTTDRHFARFPGRRIVDPL